MSTTWNPPLNSKPVSSYPGWYCHSDVFGVSQIQHSPNLTLDISPITNLFTISTQDFSILMPSQAKHCGVIPNSSPSFSHPPPQKITPSSAPNLPWFPPLSIEIQLQGCHFKVKSCPLLLDHTRQMETWGFSNTPSAALSDAFVHGDSCAWDIVPHFIPLLTRNGNPSI